MTMSDDEREAFYDDLEERVRKLNEAVKERGSLVRCAPKVFYTHPDDKAFWESHGLKCTIVDDGEGVYLEVRRDE